MYQLSDTTSIAVFPLQEDSQCKHALCECECLCVCTRLHLYSPQQQQQQLYKHIFKALPVQSSPVQCGSHDSGATVWHRFEITHDGRCSTELQYVAHTLSSSRTTAS